MEPELELISREHTAMRRTQSEAAIREIEAPLIKVLGTEQNNMQFLNANHEAADMRDKGTVAPEPFIARYEA